MSSDAVTAKALAVAGALLLVGVGSGATIHNAFQPAQAPVTENLTAVVAVERITQRREVLEGDVHSVAAGNETVRLSHDGGDWGYHADPDDDTRIRLYLQLSGSGADVRAILTPDTCGDDACRVVMETNGSGAMVDRDIVDPATSWHYTVEAAETTVSPVHYEMVWTWSTATYEEQEPGEHPHDERQGR